ncbi:MAG: winged helix-turn-helix domain-containing protein [Candidatus Hodarchaeota archaeon]
MSDSTKRNEEQKKGAVEDEEEIFKSLNHKIRRDILKIVGNRTLSFTEIKSHLDPIDSPTLSYHLKSLQSMLYQKENKYKLSEIGEAAVNLLSKTDQSIRISKYKKKFLYAYCITVICWVSASTLIPLIISLNLGNLTVILVQIVIAVISSINYVIVWTLRKKS